MMKTIGDIDSMTLEQFRRGVVIPGCPLALDESRAFAPVNQRALCRYYIDAGAGGLAVGVHATEFEIRNPEIGLFETVLEKCSEYIDEWCGKRGRRILKIAGICGLTEQAVREADFASSHGYDAGLLSLAAYSDASLSEMLEHSRAVAERIPVIGFYLQPAVGRRFLPYEFWREFVETDNVLGIKIAPFNRYRTLDVVRAVAESGRDITLYTGNDDNIVIDLLTEYKIITADGVERSMRIKGGMPEQWSCWTRVATRLLADIHSTGSSVQREVLSLASQITDCNAALFDAAHDFAGCIPGLHNILYRQGLLDGDWTLNPDARLSIGQAEEIKRVHDCYPELNDDAFVRANLSEWMSDDTAAFADETLIIEIR